MPLKNIRSDSRFRKNKTESEKSIPLPVRLNNSSEIAEKYDNYLRMLSKEHPTRMRSLRSEKKMIEERKDVLKSQVQKIKLDIREMQTAALQLDILYDKEIEFTAEKEKEINQLKGLIQLAQERKLLLEKFIAKYECARNFLAAINTPQKFKVRNLVEYYLILETLNEQFLQMEIQAMKNSLEYQEVNAEMHQYLKDHQYEVVKREKIFEDLSNQRQRVNDVNSGLKEKLSCLVEYRTEDHESWEILKRWANDVCKKISHYKEISSHSKDLSKHLDEVHEFIIAAKKVAKH